MVSLHACPFGAAAMASGVFQPQGGSGASSSSAASRPASARPAPQPLTPRAAPYEQPPWLKPLLSWWQDPAAVPGATASPGAESTAMAASEAQDAMQLLSKALGEQVVLAGIPGMPQGVLQLRCTAR